MFAFTIFGMMQVKGGNHGEMRGHVHRMLMMVSSGVDHTRDSRNIFVADPSIYQRTDWHFISCLLDKKRWSYCAVKPEETPHGGINCHIYCWGNCYYLHFLYKKVQFSEEGRGDWLCLRNYFFKKIKMHDCWEVGAILSSHLGVDSGRKDMSGSL